ncbi:Putative chitinase 3 [Acromyrmex echinatior]|uniref:Putative chitinase 3 n=1 Tax=Acromyrmex echinatior TaxID=103372 RepID=F4X2U6_ACREC|nr:Putative chitinase 3 [Acromyrmex echinatior]
MHSPLQFVISIHDPAMMLRNSAVVRQEAIARIIAIMKEVDGVELNVTAGSKERLYNFIKSLKNEMIKKSYDKRIFMALPIRSEDLAKQFDIKELMKYIDLFTLSTDYMTDEDGVFVTFHPSRLIGLFDMLNTDSLIDLISGLGAPKQKIVITVPVNAYKFTLKNPDENAPRSKTTEKEPVSIDRKELCEAINNGEWIVERDEDLTAPYAFQNKTWIAFEDKISVGIKQMQFSYPNNAKTSSFRITRIVDTEGHIRAIRENTQTEFVCKRQGYFVHPKSCNRFYRCVKFNQAIEDYSVFEFDCPAGLSFDERTEVCVWPGSLSEGSPCPGSSEIAPVTPKRFECSQPGYYADPQNCRWFFACMDLGGEELTAFEFRCPYGLIFDEKKLVCEWPWLVPACSESRSGYTSHEYNYGSHTPQTSIGVGAGSYVTSGLPEYSVTVGTDYSNMDYSKTTGIHSTNYFGTTAGDISKHPDIVISGPGHVGLSSVVGTDYSKSTKYGGAISSVPTYSNSPDIQISSVPLSTIVGEERGIKYSTTSNKIGDGYTEYTTVSTGQDGSGYFVSTGGFNTGFANRESLRGVAADFSGSTPRKYFGLSASGSYSEGTTASFSGSTTEEYSGTASGSHLKEQGAGATYLEKPISRYPNLANNYAGSVSPIIDTSYSRIPGSYFESRLPGSSIDIHVQSTSPKYDGSTNVYAGSSTLNVNDFLTSTGVYSGTARHQPSFGETGPSFGSVSYPGASGKIEITGSTDKEYTRPTTYKGSIGAGYSTGGISSGFTENDVGVSIKSGIGSSLHSTTSSSQIPGINFVSDVPKFKLKTSGISTVSGQVSFIPRPTGTSTNYRYDNEEGYTIPVFVQHEEPSIYPSIGTGVEERDHIGTTGTSGIGLTSGYGKTNLNISIFGNEIPTDYDIQKNTLSTIQTGVTRDGSNTIGDSFSRTVSSIHRNVPGVVLTPAINQNVKIPTGGGRPGYVAPSETAGYVNSDVKTINVGSASPETLIYEKSETPNPTIPINGPSTVGVLLKDNFTPNINTFGQTAPEISIGSFIQPDSTIKSSTHKSYESQSTYHGISNAPAKGSIIYSSSSPSENLIPTAPQNYRTDEERSTVTFNSAYNTNKYAEKDISDYRLTSTSLPDLIVSGRVEGTDSIYDSRFENSPTSGYSLSKSTVFTPNGFTKTGPTRTRITTAVLGGGSYSISTDDHRPTYNPDNISEKTFEGNLERVAGYRTSTSSADNLSVTLTSPGYSSKAAPDVPSGRFTVQSATSGYSYPKPTIQFGTSGVTFSSKPIVLAGSNVPITTSPLSFNRLPTSTIRPVTHTSEQPEIYKTTPFESFKIPVDIPTIRPVIDIGYKISRPISPTTIPLLNDDQFIKRTGSSQSVSMSNIGLGVPFQRTDSSGQTGHSSSLGYLPPKSIEAGVTASTTKYDLSAITAQPELIGLTYKKPSPISDVTYSPSSFHSPTTFRPSDIYYSSRRFSLGTTPFSLGTIPTGGSPTNQNISRDKINKLTTNCDRGTIKYTTPKYDTYSSSGYGIQPSTFSYEVTTKSPEGKGKVIVKWSDLHPLLLGKLGAECTCKADPFANLRGPGKKQIDSSKGKVNLANYDSSEIYVDLDYSEEDDYSTNYNAFPAQPFKISPQETTTVSINVPSSSYLPTIDARTSARNYESHSGHRMGKKLKYEEKNEEEKEEYDDDPDQIINGVTDCARPGLFRHPGLCNKFYACHWDQWKKKFTLHIFNCPVHLTFDSNESACNWPSKGPACQANNLLVVVWAMLILAAVVLTDAAVPDPPENSGITTIGSKKLATAADCAGLVAFSAIQGSVNEAKLILAETLVDKGVGYAAQTGIFTTHCPGFYQFSFAGYGSTDLRLTLKRKLNKSNSWRTIISAGPGGGSNLVLLDVEAGDQLAVFVESGKIIDGASFTGHRVYKR